MRKLAKLITIIALSFLTFATQAQTPSGKLTGKVKDAAQAGISAATVTLLKAKDSSSVKIAVSDKTGNYEFENIPEGKYLVSVTAVGFVKAFSKTIVLSAGSGAIADPVTLSPLTKELKAVTVTGQRPPVEQKIDRTVVNVEASITNAGANALEVLEKSPGITVDKDGNISLKGKDGVTVLIDGRPTYLSASDLANLLKSMHASQLDQIEIMTNPPAKYDAEGNAGVINIKTKKNKQFGYNGSFNLGYSQGYYPKFNEGFNFNYRNSKLNFFTNASHNYNLNRNQLNIQRNFRNKDTKEFLSYFDQKAQMRNEGTSASIKTGLDYFAGKNTTLGVVLTGYYNPRTYSTRSVSDISNSSGTFTDQTIAVSPNNQQWKNFSSNINFRQLIDTSGTELTSDLDFIVYDSRNNQRLYNYYYDESGNVTAKGDTLLGALPQNIKIYSAKVDFVHPLKKGGRFEAGIKSSYVRTDNDANYDSVTFGNTVHDFNRSNHFLYEENINAAYANLNAPLGKKWGAQLGLRAENTNAKGNQLTTSQNFNRHYTQLFPTAYLQYTANKSNTFVLNYGRRIRRPNYQSLNPFINFIDRYTYSQGNPDLKPQFSHNIELSHTYKGFLTTTLNYTRTTDIIQQIIEQDEIKNETFVHQANIAKQRQYGISVNANNPFTKWWRNSFYINVYNNKFDGIINNGPVSISATTMTINSSQQFQFAKTWSAEISGWFRTAGIEGVIAPKAMGSMSIGLGKQILKNSGTVRLNVRDVLNTQHFSAISKYGNVDAAFQERPESRVVSISFSYRFMKGKMNNAPKRRTNSAGDEQNRVGVGN